MRHQWFLLAAILAAGAAAPAQADKVLAHSKSLGMSFTAQGDPWCREDVKIQVTAEDAARFVSDEYLGILQKLGYVLARECPEAQNLTIAGEAAGSSVWRGRAERTNNWIAQSIPMSPSVPATANARVDAPVATATDTEDSAPAQPAAVPAPEPRAASREDPASDPAPAVPAAPPALEIAGWQPGGLLQVGEGAASAHEIMSRSDGCRVHVLIDVKSQFGPDFKTNRDYECVNGFVHSSPRNHQMQVQLYYEGQKQPFAHLNGLWLDGFNLDRGMPRQVVARQQVTTRDRWNRTFKAEKLLVWLGEDRELRAHYFTTYAYNNHVWRLENSPLIVLTDNPELKTEPARTTLARSIAGLYRDYFGYRSTDSFNAVNFVITDKFSLTPFVDYQRNLSAQNPDPAFHKAGRAVRQRGMPWRVEISTDFEAKRLAFVEAERKRQELERQRLAQLRAQHQASLDGQYQELTNASPYDRVRFYATLQLAKEQLTRNRIDFTSTRAYRGSVLSGALAFSHPAQYLNQADAGRVQLQGPLYLLVEADDGEIEAPYAMQVSHNASGTELDGWMLIRMEPEFGFEFDGKGRPMFEIAVDQAVACRTDKCLEEMEADAMMKAWYEDDDMEFNLAARP